MKSLPERIDPARAVEIRKLTEADAQAWWDLRLEALTSDARSFGKSVREHRQTRVEEIARRYRDAGPGTIHLGAFDVAQPASPRLVGMATFLRNQSDRAGHKGHIYGVYVAQSHRRLGVAHAIIAKLLELARKDPPGLEAVLLAVAAENTAARRLYESFGFRVFGREPRAVRIAPGDYVDEDHMILELSRDASPEAGA